MSSSNRDAEYKVAKEAQDVFRECITFAMAGQKDRLEGAVTGFLKAHPDMTAPEMVGGFQSEGRTLLHVSASSGHAPVVDFLLGLLPSTARAELINTPDDRGFTPLLNAVIGENDTVTARLIALGGDVKRLNKDDAGCMHFAAGDGSVPRLRLLVEAGADPCPPSKTGGTPLHWAAGKARAAAIEYLLFLRSSHGIDINATAGTGVPAVIMAAGASCDAGVAALVEAGADCGALLAGNLTVLHICAENNLLHAARALIATPTGLHCAQLETTDGNRPVHLAAMVGNAEMVALLAPVSEAGSVEAITAEGPARLHKWELAHGKQSPAPASSASPSEASGHTSDGVAPPRSARVLEPVSPAASPALALEAAAHKDSANELFKQKRFAEALEVSGARTIGSCYYDSPPDLTPTFAKLLVPKSPRPSLSPSRSSSPRSTRAP